MNHSRVEVIVESRCEMPPPYWCLFIDASSLRCPHWCLLIDASSSLMNLLHHCLLLINASSSSMSPSHPWPLLMPPTHQCLLLNDTSSSSMPPPHWCPPLIKSDVIKVKAIQCFLPTGDFFSYFKGIISSHKESLMPMNHSWENALMEFPFLLCFLVSFQLSFSWLPIIS